MGFGAVKRGSACPFLAATGRISELPWEASVSRRPVPGGTSGVSSGAMAMHRVLPLSRFRLRTLMLLVLLAAVALGTERAWHRRQEYLDRAAYHAAEEAKLSAVANALAAELACYRPLLRRPGCGNPRRYAEALESVMPTVATGAAEHGRLKRRYLRAASRPWKLGPGREPPSPMSAPFPSTVAAAGCSSP